MRRSTLVAAALLAAAGPVTANQLRVETVSLNQRRVVARVLWKNSWRNARNHDAVWIVVKVRSGANRWTHARLAGVTAQGTPNAACSVSSDRVGAFCAPTATHRGEVNLQLEIDLQPGNTAPTEAIVFGVEMVYIPAGPFTIGDPDTSLVRANAFYRSDAQGRHAGTYRVTSESEIRVAPAAGALYYRASQYGGDALGPVPAAFPKGTRAFFVMKYEILQGQYATFLNMIAEQASSFRSPIGGRDYALQRGSLRIENGRYIAASPDRPANFMSWDDGTAFADWAGLRPWTELEYTKAARGPAEPIATDFPWGTTSKERLLRRNAPNDELVQSGAADESNLTDAARDVLGASYYWVMDLAGSVWEKVVTIGHPRGRAFRGTHGDGEITEYGLANTSDWPLGDYEAGGYGYRGGGYYERGSAETALNPHSRVEQRPYGSWGGGPRGVAYGFRAARTADD